MLESQQQGAAANIDMQLPDRSSTQSVDAETIYSVGPHSTNESTQQPMQNRSFDQSHADTVPFSAYAVMCESGYTGPVVIDDVDTDAYVAAAVLWQKLAGMIFIKRKHETSTIEHKSSTIAEARAAKWKRMNNKSFICLPPYADSLRQHCLRAN